MKLPPLLQAVANLAPVEIPDGCGVVIILADGKETRTIRINLDAQNAGKLLDAARSTIPVEVAAPVSVGGKPS